MISDEELQKVVHKVVNGFRPNKIILFGSYARDEADEGSDLDLLIVESELSDKGQEMIEIRHAIGNIGIGVGVDILVCSEREVNEWGHLPSGALYWALKEGKVLYEATY